MACYRLVLQTPWSPVPRMSLLGSSLLQVKPVASTLPPLSTLLEAISSTLTLRLSVSTALSLRPTLTWLALAATILSDGGTLA